MEGKCPDSGSFCLCLLLKGHPAQPLGSHVGKQRLGRDGSPQLSGRQSSAGSFPSEAVSLPGGWEATIPAMAVASSGLQTLHPFRGCGQLAAPSQGTPTPSPYLLKVPWRQGKCRVHTDMATERPGSQGRSPNNKRTQSPKTSRKPGVCGQPCTGWWESHSGARAAGACPAVVTPQHTTQRLGEGSGRQRPVLSHSSSSWAAPRAQVGELVS